MSHNLKEISLKEFLKYKTLYYDKIDYSYIQKSFDILKKHIKLPFVIHIVGTNGKGSTGRYLASYLDKKGFDTLHYSSPHINKFNERIWINNKYVGDESLEKAHKFLQKILSLEYLKILTYFEYTTLLAFFLSSNRDYLVLEAGLGGEFDATNVAKNDLSLITTIDLDHQDFLGNTIKEIAFTKMRSVDTTMILGYQIHKEIKSYALELKKQKGFDFFSIEDFDLKLEDFNFKIPNYLKRNLLLVTSALKYLNIELDYTIFENIKFEGRCQKVDKNITCDVGHNPLAALSLLEEFKGKKINLVYNSFQDKDYEKVLKILKPIIKKLHILPIEDKRALNIIDLATICEKLNIISDKFKIENVKDEEEYLVFGSFLVVEKFLKLKNREKEINE